MNGLNSEKMQKKYSLPNKCIDCGTPICKQAKRCKRCSAIYYGKFEDMAKYVPGFLNDKIEGIDYVTCVLCGYRSGSLQAHLHYTHNLTPSEYRKQYNAEPFSEKHLEEKREQWSGEKNPGYNHGGKLSPWSYNNPSKSKEEIDLCKAKTLESILQSDKLNTKIEYWLKFTNGDKELAEKLLATRQSTFSKEKCIKKYGKEKGLEIWKMRQEKWQNTLDNKSNEEKAEINRKKIYKNGIASKGELELFNELHKEFPELESQKYFKYNNTHYYFYDICLGNKIIEYNGDYWHANPKIYNANSIIKYPRKTVMAKDVWEGNEIKLQFAKNLGYDILVIWESDYKNNKDDVINKCRSFLSEATI